MSLFAPALMGCTHVDASQARHHNVVAAHAHRPHALGQISQHERSETLPRARVDLSESPHIVDQEPAPPSFAPGPLYAVTEIASWVEAEQDAALLLELRNACNLDFSYAFAPGSDPSAAQPRRSLGAHSMQMQEVSLGHWLHLWHADRWLGSATTTVEGGTLQLSSDCETLEVHVDMPEGGPTQFAIHWDLDAEPSDSAAVPAPETIELQLDLATAPEQWGAARDAADAPIELRVLNLCAEPALYAFTDDLGDDPEHSSTLPGHSERFVAVPAGWWFRHRRLDDSWHSGATTTHSGATLWLGPDCVDHGIGDGDEIGNF